MALDGSNHGNTSTGTVALTLATAAGSGRIFCVLATNAASVTSVTAPGLTFAADHALFSTFGGSLAVYSAPYTSNFSGTITVVVATAVFTTVDVFAFGGADTTAGSSSPPYDSGSVPLPSSVNLGAAVTTANANDDVFFVASLSNATDTPSGAWTAVPGSGASFLLTAYQQNVGPATYTATSTGGFINGSLIGAIKQAAGGSARTPTLTLMGVG